MTEDLALRWEPPRALQQPPYSTGFIADVNGTIKTSTRDKPRFKTTLQGNSGKPVFALGTQATDPEMAGESGAPTATSS